MPDAGAQSSNHWGQEVRYRNKIKHVVHFKRKILKEILFHRVTLHCVELSYHFQNIFKKLPELNMILIIRVLIQRQCTLSW